MTGITAYIYRDATTGRCANGGISDSCDRVTLVLPGGGPATPSPEEPPVRIVPGNLPGTLKAISLDDDNRLANTHLGPMMGGTYIASADSRFAEECERVLGDRFDGGVPLHDRYETPAQYRALSV